MSGHPPASDTKGRYDWAPPLGFAIVVLIAVALLAYACRVNPDRPMAPTPTAMATPTEGAVLPVVTMTPPRPHPTNTQRPTATTPPTVTVVPTWTPVPEPPAPTVTPTAIFQPAPPVRAPAQIPHRR